MKNNLQLSIIDNFFTEDIHKEIYDILIHKSQWSFTGGNINNPFWHIDNLEKVKYFNDFLLNIIRQKAQISEDFSIGRIYTNGQTAGQCGYPHTDDGHLTFLYFPNLEWEIGWQGHLFFVNKTSPIFGTKDREDWDYVYDENDEVSQVVKYKPNRAVFFPSHIVHYADAPHRLFNWIRLSLAYKFDKL